MAKKETIWTQRWYNKLSPARKEEMRVRAKEGLLKRRAAETPEEREARLARQNAYRQEHFRKNPSIAKKRKAYVKKWWRKNGKTLSRLRMLDPQKRARRDALHATLMNTPHYKYVKYRAGARHRNIAFKISFKYFMTFWQKPCAYDGTPIETIGLDRIDSTKGYVEGNLVPCCFECNGAKSKRSHEQYIAHCERVANFNK